MIARLEIKIPFNKWSKERLKANNKKIGEKDDKSRI